MGSFYNELLGCFKGINNYNKDIEIDFVEKLKLNFLMSICKKDQKLNFEKHNK
jgi:hypothetical protein